MIITEKKVKTIVDELWELLVLESYTSKERAELAKKAGLSYETLRSQLRRKTMNSDTLIRLMLARGIDPKTITNLPQKNLKVLEDSEAEWIRMGRKLTATQRKSCMGLIKYLLSKWI